MTAKNRPAKSGEFSPPDKIGTSYDALSDVDPVDSPIVAITLSVLFIPEVVRHLMSVSEFHSDASHPDTLILTMGQLDHSPNDTPLNVRLADPVVAVLARPVVLATESDNPVSVIKGRSYDPTSELEPY